MTDFFALQDQDAFYRYIGVAGFLLYVTVYSCLSLRILSSESIRYFVCNTFAAGLVLISLSNEFNLASALIQIFWIVLGLIGITLRVMHRWQQTLYTRR